jgi:hypothetical protein
MQGGARQGLQVSVCAATTATTTTRTRTITKTRTAATAATTTAATTTRTKTTKIKTVTPPTTMSQRYITHIQILLELTNLMFLYATLSCASMHS